MKESDRIIVSRETKSIKVNSPTLAQLYEDAAKAMYQIIVGDRPLEGEPIEKEIMIEGVDRDTLMVSWLTELLTLTDTEGVVFNRLLTSEVTETQIKAKVLGYENHNISSQIQSVPMDLKITFKDDWFSCHIVFE